MDCTLHGFRGRIRLPLAVMFLMFCDLVALFAALVLALILRYDNLPLRQIANLYLLPRAAGIVLSLAAYIVIFSAFRLYQYAWRFASLDVARGVIIGCTLGLGSTLAVQTVVDQDFFRTSVYVILWMSSILLVGGVRIVLRLLSLSRVHGRRALKLLGQDVKPKRVVILGGGASGVRLLSVLKEELGSSYQVIGFLDDEPQKHGVYIRDVRVLGPMSKLYDLLNDRAVDEVLVALPRASGKDIREYVLECRRRRVPVRVIPAVQDVLNGKAHPHIEDIRVEDLLRRPPVELNAAKVGEFLNGKRIMVTGAGGSIGSEVCRQVITHNPSALILLGHGENSINQIYLELKDKHPGMVERLCMVIASVADENRMHQVFQAYRPDIVVHTAAHKHVPLMEANVLEAAQNNVIGTSIVAEAAGRYGVEKFVLISSDKAVYPSSVMGATKWLCERVVRSMVGRYRNTTYITVRFGNVLGSRGSVVPLFYEQIRKGGPVTVTHPEMTRYFMSIPEAVQLILQAGALGKSGELYALDMGEPIRILDLAEDMIRLCGLEPGKDIEIVFTGSRPGEKLHERLAADDETIEPGFCEGLSVVRRPIDLTPTEVEELIRHIRQIVNRGDEQAMRELLEQVVPEFSRSKQAVRLPNSAARV
ncbi:MAG: nucleoside-diphosphate sugar epimerase/dehydratase [Armatimonadota bacterium]|nr:nucleoside-diphosphate sugar epimerase/dehydratase [Armatimonadota bacterium]